MVAKKHKKYDLKGKSFDFSLLIRKFALFLDTLRFN